MPEMDWIVSGRTAQWLLRDRRTGRTNMDIDWRFRVGDVVKLRLVNDRSALHAMQHPIHIHGQRFLVLTVNDSPNENLVWKDTVLLPTGFAADVLLEVTNPGRWMLHCHIAEHIETGMRMVFEVKP
jgi:FtsP/CotA-like multicopper oxidase with cupredoxin domain